MKKQSESDSSGLYSPIRNFINTPLTKIINDNEKVKFFFKKSHQIIIKNSFFLINKAKFQRTNRRI